MVEKLGLRLADPTTFRGDGMAQALNIGSAQRRKAPRRDVLLAARLDGTPVRLLNLSFGGVEIAMEQSLGIDPLAIIGSEHLLEFDGVAPRTAKFLVSVIWAERSEGLFGACFQDLDDQQYEKLERLVAGRAHS